MGKGRTESSILPFPFPTVGKKGKRREEKIERGQEGERPRERGRSRAGGDRGRDHERGCVVEQELWGERVFDDARPGVSSGVRVSEIKVTERKESGTGGCRSRAREFGTEYVSWEAMSLVRCSGREGCQPKGGNRGTPCHFECWERREGARGTEVETEDSQAEDELSRMEDELEECLAVWCCPRKQEPSGVVRGRRNPRGEGMWSESRGRVREAASA